LRSLAAAVMASFGQETESRRSTKLVQNRHSLNRQYLALSRAALFESSVGWGEAYCVERRTMDDGSFAVESPASLCALLLHANTDGTNEGLINEVSADQTLNGWKDGIYVLGPAIFDNYPLPTWKKRQHRCLRSLPIPKSIEFGRLE
jgi:hypothetical protein